MVRAAAAVFPFLAVLGFGSSANADDVSEAMKRAMKECVTINAPRIGSPTSNNAMWADAVAGFTVMGFSMVQITGIQGHANLEEAIKARAGDYLIDGLEQNGIQGFRRQALETLDYCLPFALVAAENEMQRQKTAVCPDDTGYREQVKIVTSSDAELRREFGKFAEDIKNLSPFSIKIKFLNAFPEIFDYGQRGHPEFSEPAYDGLHAALKEVRLSKFQENRPFVDEALASIREMNGEYPERIKVIQRELTCIKDWLDIYPSEEIMRLESR